MEILVPFAIGTAFNYVTSLFLPAQTSTQKAPTPNLRTPRSSYGSAIPYGYGRFRVEGNTFLPDDPDKMYRVEVQTETTGGGKGGAPTQTVERNVYYGTWGVLFTEGNMNLDWLNINGNSVTTDHNFYQTYGLFFNGTQLSPWSAITALYNSPEKDVAYKDLCYIGFEDAPLEQFGNLVPQQMSAVLQNDSFPSNPDLGAVVADICLRAGYQPAEIDTTDLTGIEIKSGFILPQGGETYRKSIEELAQIYLFAVCEENEQLIFKKYRRDVAEPITILDYRDFIPISAEGIDNAIAVCSVASKDSLPAKIVIGYYNQLINYDVDNKIIWEEDTDEERDTLTISTQLCSYPDHIQDKGEEIRAHLFQSESKAYSFILPIQFLDRTKPLSLLQLPSGEVVQVYQREIGADYTLRIQSKHYSGVIDYAPTDPGTSQPNPSPDLPDPTLSLPLIFVVDTVTLKENDPPSTLYFFATDRTQINFSLNNGDSFGAGTTHFKASTIGTLINGTKLLDSFSDPDTTVLDVRLDSGSLESVSQAEFDAGMNLMLVGHINNGFYEGEIIQARDVTPLGNDEYQITYMKRGLKGTQSYTKGYHQENEKLFLITGVGAYYSQSSGSESFIGQPIQFVPVVADWQDIGSTPVTTVTPVGNSYKPPEVTNLAGEIDQIGNIRYTWDYAPLFSPFNKENQSDNVSFRIEFLDAPNGNVVRTLNTARTSVIYFYSQRQPDGLGTAINVRITSVSPLVGDGFAIEELVTPTSAGDVVFGEGDVLTKIIVGNYTVIESDNNYLLLAQGITENIDITFPSSLSDGFRVYVANDKDNDDYRVTVKDTSGGGGDNFWTTTATRIVYRGQDTFVLHLSEGKFISLPSGMQQGQYDSNNDGSVNNADFATNAGFATTAGHASTADNATLADDATRFGGELPTEYLDKDTYDPDRDGIVAHIIQDSSSTLPQQRFLKFIGGVTVTDQSTITQVEIATSGLLIADESQTFPSRGTLRFTGSGKSVTDNPGNGSTDVDIPGGGGGGGDITRVETIAYITAAAIG